MGLERCTTCRPDIFNPGKMICDAVISAVADSQNSMASGMSKDWPGKDIDEAFEANERLIQDSLATARHYLKNDLGCQLSDESIKHNVDYLKQTAQGE